MSRHTQAAVQTTSQSRDRAANDARSQSRHVLLLAVLITLSFGAARSAMGAMYVVNSDAADGAVYRLTSNGNYGTFNTQALIVGAASGPANYNGIMFFALPDPLLGIDRAALHLTLTSPNTLPFNTDLWGIGYIHGSPALVGSWEVHADTDPRILLNGVAPTKLVNNLVAANTAAATLTTNIPQSIAIGSYLQSLYTAGAVAGDFVVLRVNADGDTYAQTNSILTNFRWGTDVQSAPAQLTITTVPEPASAAMLLIGGAATLMRRRQG
ncbi:MAG: PEP-CTERM sorting domain-containing protein [Planctomycetes bacterium]|nr:PEP-CTERM sorting domain-containing protein [Planctomycetota bacterium]